MIPARSARVAVLLAWAGFFAVLWVTGTWERYLGPRTQWVVPFGAITLAAAALLSGRAGGRRPLTVRDGLALIALLAPLVAVLLVPHAQLGAFAASRKAGSYFPQVLPPPPASPRDATFLDIRVAEKDAHWALRAGIKDGLRVRLVGLVTRTGRTRFELARFYITCCVADAQPVGVPVEAGGRRVRRDEWLTVTGVLDRRGRRYVVVADAIRPARRPADPYLTFVG